MDTTEITETNRRIHSSRVATRYHVIQTAFVVFVTLLVALAVINNNRGISRNQMKIQETLDAIKQLSIENKNAANDNKLTSKRLGDTIVCMLLVPESRRTTDTQNNCQSQAMTTTPNGTVLENPSPEPPSQPANTQQFSQPPTKPDPPKSQGLLPDRIPIVGPLL